MDINNDQRVKNGKNYGKKKAPSSNTMQLVKTKIFGVNITNASGKEVLEYLLNFLKNSSKKLFIVTPNPEIIVLAQAQPEFKSILNKADVALCDGAGLFFAAQVVGRPLKERIIGTNFMEMVCKAIADWPITVGFLGGRPGVAEKAAECLTAKYPGLKVAFIGNKWGEEGFVNAQQYQISSLKYDGDDKKKGPLIIPHTVDILFVAFGAPKQEQWMAAHLDTLPVRVMMGVGGAFDQIVTPSLRPPAVVHAMGLGWLYRLIREPWRFKRQTRLFGFVWLVLKERFLGVATKS